MTAFYTATPVCLIRHRFLCSTGGMAEKEVNMLSVNDFFLCNWRNGRKKENYRCRIKNKCVISSEIYIV